MGFVGGDTIWYFPNGSKTHVLAKPHTVEATKQLLKNTGTIISTEGEIWEELLEPPLLYASILRER